MSKGLFHAYGMFWKRDEIRWNPGSGARGEFMLLGRRGKQKGSLRPADFRRQNGIYVLFGNHGFHYVGLTRTGGFGRRLKAHLSDRHRNQWTSFCWFSFGEVLKSKDLKRRFQKFREVKARSLVETKSLIGDLEALLIAVSVGANANNMKFAQAELWHQVTLAEVDEFMDRVW